MAHVAYFAIDLLLQKIFLHQLFIFRDTVMDSSFMLYRILSKFELIGDYPQSPNVNFISKLTIDNFRSHVLNRSHESWDTFFNLILFP